jgi:uncharacterized membrane protein YccC
LAGALVMHGRLAPEVAVLTGRAEALAVENKTLTDRVDNLAERARRLEQQLAEADGQPAKNAEQPPASSAVDAAAMLSAEETDMADVVAPLSADQRRRRGVQIEGDEPVAETGQPEEGPGEAEGRAARFREFETQMRDRVKSALQQEYETASDADAQERIEILDDYVEQIAQLREEMRNAETDEERAVLRQAMRESFENMNEIVRTQQDSMLRSLAANSGVTDPGKQDAFIAGLRDLQTSPFFQADRMMGGGVRGPWRPESRMGGGGGGRPEGGGRQR